MSKLDELIQQYCPDVVEYMKLGEVCKALPKGTLTTKELVEPNGHNYPVINSGRELYGYYTHFNNEGDAFTVAARGEYAGFITYFSGKFWAGGLCYPYKSYSPNISTKFIFYYLKTRQEYIRNTLVTEGSIPALNKGTLDLFEIPVPPLPVQEEIVRILDNFTELQAELQAELQKRKLQYNYYLDNLLSFNRGEQTEVKWMKLKDVATQWYRGAGIKREEVSEDGMPCIRYGEIHTTYNIWFDDCISHTDESKQASRKYAEKGDILFAITSEDIPLVGNSVAYLGNERIMVGGDIVVMKHNQDPKYMAYALSTSDAIKQKGKGKVKSKVVHTNVPSLQEIVIPIPSLVEQQRIVSILDRFDTLTTDLTQGLPAEIEKRRQQYEYYRDKLLTFKRKEA